MAFMNCAVVLDTVMDCVALKMEMMVQKKEGQKIAEKIIHKRLQEHDGIVLSEKQRITYFKTIHNYAEAFHSHYYSYFTDKFGEYPTREGLTILVVSVN